ncbi:MAG: hypothetical protein WA738_00015, partial [Candidatus Angelobacter sp.]
MRSNAESLAAFAAASLASLRVKSFFTGPRCGPPMEALIVDELIEQIRLTARALAEFGSHLFDPTIRLG